MRIELVPGTMPAPRWPAAVKLRTFAPGDAIALHSLLEDCYRDGGGDVHPYETWLPRMIGDDEFDPDLWFLAEADRIIVGAALCWTSAFSSRISSSANRAGAAASARLCSDTL